MTNASMGEGTNRPVRKPVHDEEPSFLVRRRWRATVAGCGLVSSWCMVNSYLPAIEPRSCGLSSLRNNYHVPFGEVPPASDMSRTHQQDINIIEIGVAQAFQLDDHFADSTRHL